MKPTARRRRVLPRSAVPIMVAVALLAAGLALAPTGRVSAHPLGNFTINQYSRVQLAADRVALRYVLDMAEIPAFQEVARIDLDRDGAVSEAESHAYLTDKAAELRRGFHLSINGSPVTLEVTEQDVSFPPGQGGLPTLRLGLLLSGQWGVMSAGEAQEVYYRNNNYTGRPGWNEVVLRPGEGISLVSATAPQEDRSAGLLDYPQDLLIVPPDLREARATFRVVATPARSDHLGPAPAATGPAVKPRDPFVSLVSAEKLDLPVIVLSLALALGLGALHGLSPGHGKTITAAYLVGSNGMTVHALLLGLTVTIAHSLGVLALGLVTLYASHLILPERLYPWLGLGSGVLILAIGGQLLVSRLRRHRDAFHHHFGSGPAHHHQGFRLTWKNLGALGVVDGLMPSASALLILLAAISIHRIAFGLVLILAYSLGMAAVLAGLGLFLVHARHLVGRWRFENRKLVQTSRLLPVVAALVVLASGIFVTARAILQIGA